MWPIRVRLFCVAAIAFAVTLPAGFMRTTAAADRKPPVLNRRVLEFAESQTGMKVGNGECWTLAARALEHARARPARGYVFGRKIAADQMQPGDIIQFTSVRVAAGRSTYYLGLPNHTAVISAVEGDKVTILHQNFGKKIVTEFTFDVTKIVAGKFQTYRPSRRR